MTARLSVVAVTNRGPRSLRYMIERLAEQTIADQIELVIAVDPERAEDDWHDTRFAAVRVVPCDVSTTARGRAVAMGACGTPIAACLEDHSYPADPTWAETVLELHSAPAAAFGPVITNANPDSGVSWANLLTDYSGFMHASAPVDTDHLPGHNCTYKVAGLLRYGDELPDLMEAEYVLHKRLAADGALLTFTPALRTAHINYSRLADSLMMQHLNGHMFAASRSRDWPVWRRAVYAAGFPGIIALRFARALGRISDVPKGQRVRTIGSLAALLTASGIGEGLGYAFGDMGRREDMAELEYNRWPRLTAQDQARFAILME